MLLDSSVLACATKTGILISCFALSINPFSIVSMVGANSPWYAVKAGLLRLRLFSNLNSISCFISSGKQSKQDV